MARGSSKSSGGTGNRRASGPEQPTEEHPPAVEHGDHAAAGTDSPETGPDAVAAASDERPRQESDGPADDRTDPDGGPEQDTDAEHRDPAPDAIPDAEVVAESEAREAETDRPAPHSPAAAPPPARAPEPARGGGLVPMVLGGVLAAGIGYGAAYMGWLPTAPASDDASAEVTEALAALQAQVAELAARPQADPVAAPEIDLTQITEQIGAQIGAQFDALSSRLDGASETLAGLADRVAVLEDRPVFSGDLDADGAAALEAATALEAELEAQRAAAAEQAAALQAAAEAAATAAAEAEAQAAAAIAAAEAEAAAALDRAQAGAALVELEAALQTGAPFADALAELSDVADLPESLVSVADAGVPTLDALQDSFPPLARAALPIALQETAGEGVGDRLGAFLMGQVGGRSVEPREGDDPDAVLSRIEAAVGSGDLRGALSELAALPEGAQAALASWAADVEARAAATEGFETLSGALAASGN